MANVWNGTHWVDEATGNTYDPNEGVWRDPSTGNWQDPETGLWVNPQGQRLVNGVWSNGASVGGQFNTATPTQAQGTNSGTPFVSNPGWAQSVLDQTNAQQTKVTGMNNQTQLELQRLTNESQQRVAQMQAEVQREIAKGNNASAERIAQLNAEIQRESNRIAMYNAETQRMTAEAQRREAEARMAANPNDLVAYEFFKRNLGTPSSVVSANSRPGGSSQRSGRSAADALNGGGAGTGAASAAGPDNNPAYSDAALQTLAGSLFSGGNPNSWNPGLSGTGVFGAQIAAPNSMGRAAAMGLTEQQRGILNSFLSGGININGRRVAINPQDWWDDVQKSWIPTLQEGAAGATQYI